MCDSLKCYKCSWLAYRESGYSEHTVTNTWIECMCGRFDQENMSYEDKQNKGLIEIASKDCPYWREGEPVQQYVEDCDDYELRLLALEAYKKGR